MNAPELVGDLARIRGSAGAADQRTGLTDLGPELYAVPFWTPEFCAAIVRAASLGGVSLDV